jgi:hypothetical protein
MRAATVILVTTRLLLVLPYASERDARRWKWEILMAYPAATVRIEKTDESGRAV